MSKIYYKDNNVRLYKGDCINILDDIEEKSIDMIFADPPYFLSNGGITCKSGKMSKVDKGKWDKVDSFEGKYKFNKEWISKCKRVLKDNGTMWISGTIHNIYVVGFILEELGFKILNNITWEKTNPPPNISCRYFTHSTETILWVRKEGKKKSHFYNYKLMDFQIVQLPRMIYDPSTKTYKSMPFFYQTEKEEILEKEINSIKKLVKREERYKYFR